jgi:4-nitrophenyl phosphatase
MEAIHALRAAGKRLFFVTNNSAKSRAAYRDKFASFGVTVGEDEIITSGSSTASYLATHHPHVRAVYCIGEQGLVDELRAVGVRVLTDDASARMVESEIAEVQLDPSVGAVVVGHDLSFSYRKLAMACTYLCQPNCLYLATNADRFDLLPGGTRRMPAAGCMVAAISAACGVDPVAIGKPNAAMAHTILAGHALDPSRTIVVGDRLDTDIALAASAGLGGSCLCLSGCTTAEMLADASRYNTDGSAGGRAVAGTSGAAEGEARLPTPTFVVDCFAHLLR